MVLLGRRIKVYINKIYQNTKNPGEHFPVCKGCFYDGDVKKDTFVLGFDPSEKTIARVKIIAILSYENTTKYVTAPFGKVFYEPDIRKILSHYIQKDFTLSCHFEKSCGAVVFRRKSGNIEYLLIKNKMGTNWGFPKGHVELGENEIQTATREVREETGLKISPLEGFREVNEYRPHGNVSKRVVLFLAEASPDDEIVIQQSEIERFIWADYALAQRTFKFNNDRNVLTRARDWISGKGI